MVYFSNICSIFCIRALPFYPTGKNLAKKTGSPESGIQPNSGLPKNTYKEVQQTILLTNSSIHAFISILAH